MSILEKPFMAHWLSKKPITERSDAELTEFFDQLDEIYGELFITPDCKAQTEEVLELWLQVENELIARNLMERPE